MLSHVGIYLYCISFIHIYYVSRSDQIDLFINQKTLKMNYLKHPERYKSIQNIMTISNTIYIKYIIKHNNI